MEPSSLWQQFGAPLRAFVARRAPTGVDSEDVVQDVFVRIQERLSSLRDTERIDAWIFQIARNVVTDAFRSRGRRTALAERSAHEAPAVVTDDDDDATGAGALAACLGGMIDRLDEPYREAIVLTEIEGLTQVEAAERVGLSISGMKSRVQRGREHLKAIIRGSCRVELDVRGGVVECDPHDRARCGERLRPSSISDDSRA